MKAICWRLFGGFPGWVVALAAVASASGQDLQEDSPFLPADYQQAPAAPPPPPQASPLDKLELRSVSVLGGVHHFSLFDTSSSKGFWIKLNETVQGVSVSDYNKPEGSVLVRSGGFSKRLKLKEAKIIALNVPPPSAQPVVGGGPAVTAAAGAPNMTTGTAVNTGAPPAAINNLSDDEVRARMQKVAEEIRRRRAMRRDMAEQASGQPKQ